MVNCGLARKDPSPLLLTTMKQQIKQGMTIIALGDDGCVIGAAINSSVTPLDPKNIRKLSKCAENRAVANIMIYFAYIVELPRLWITHDISKYFECSMIAVDPDYQGFGIAKKLAHDSWLLARDCGFTLFRIDCSSKQVYFTYLFFNDITIIVNYYYFFFLQIYGENCREIWLDICCLSSIQKLCQ